MAFRVLAALKRNRFCHASILVPVSQRLSESLTSSIRQYHAENAQPTPEEWASFKFDQEDNPYRFYPDQLPEFRDEDTTPTIHPKSRHRPVVFYGEQSGVRTVILNRNHKKNKPTQKMLKSIFEMLQFYQESNDVKAVIIRSGAGVYAVAPYPDLTLQKLIKSTEEVYFCSGYGTNHFWRMRKIEDKLAKTLCDMQFSLVSQISKLTKPFVAYMDGHMTGCGIGLPMAARYRVCSSDSTIHFPEASFGFIPNCGASYFLSRLPYNLGRYLALTGDTLRGYDLIHAGFATHFMSQQQFNYFANWVTRGSGHRGTVPDWLEICDQSTVSPHPQPFIFSDDTLSMINDCFRHDRVWKIVTALEVAEGTCKSEQRKFVQRCLKNIRRASPTSLNVTLQQIIMAKRYSLDRCLKMEYGLVHELLTFPDFCIGIEAKRCGQSEVPIWSKPLDQNDESWLEIFNDAKRHEFKFLKPDELSNQHILGMTDSPQPFFSHDPKFADYMDFKRTWR